MCDYIITCINCGLAGFIIGTFVTRHRTTKQIFAVLRKCHEEGKTLKDILDEAEKAEKEDEAKK